MLVIIGVLVISYAGTKNCALVINVLLFESHIYKCYMIVRLVNHSLDSIVIYDGLHILVIVSNTTTFL